MFSDLNSDFKSAFLIFEQKNDPKWQPEWLKKIRYPKIPKTLQQKNFKKIGIFFSVINFNWDCVLKWWKYIKRLNFLKIARPYQIFNVKLLTFVMWLTCEIVNFLAKIDVSRGQLKVGHCPMSHDQDFKHNFLFPHWKVL